MATFDVRNDAGEEVTAIQWRANDAFNLIPYELGVTFYVERKISRNTSSLASSKKEAEHLISALQKAIELGWLK